MENARIRIAKQFIMQKKLGAGSFGEVYLGLNTSTNEEVAIKLEESQSKFPQILSEAKILSSLKGPGIPKIFWYGTEGKFNIMVQELLGQSLEEIYSKNNRHFSVKSLLCIAQQIFNRIEAVHSQNYIHRDIKPDNFLFGLNKKSSVLYIIDFGLSKKYRDSATKQHIKFSDKRTLTGTARYASINSHMGHEQSRRDDLEAIMYLIIYLFLGTLPWQGVQCSNKMEKYRTIMDMKIASTPETLCKNLPGELAQMLGYCRSLRFEDNPDYGYFKGQIEKMAESEKVILDNKFEWMKSKKKKAKRKGKEGKAEVKVDAVKEDDIVTDQATSRWPEFNDREKIRDTIGVREIQRTESKNCPIF